MNQLFLLTEDDTDDLFFELCAERISGLAFDAPQRRMLRTSGGINALYKVLATFLQQIRAYRESGAIYFIIALDNDRSPRHPSHDRLPGLSSRDHQKDCRYCKIEREIMRYWGADRLNWPAQGAIAVPVEMLESWVLLAIEPERESLPIFATKDSGLARAYHHGNPPEQLKDLFAISQMELGHESKGNFLLHIAEELDVDALSAASPSFADFRDQVSQWK